MNPGHSTVGQTRVDDQHPDIWPSSPNALVAVFSAILQARFFEQGGEHPLPWFWSADPTPTDDAGGDLDTDTAETAGRRIYIESGPLDQPLARNVRPALIVTRGAIQYKTLGVGRSAVIDYPRMGRLLYCHGASSISIQCISREAGESQTLADVVASFFYASAAEIRAEFGIHDIGDPVIAPPTPYARASGEIPAWSTEVGVPVEIIYRWYKWPLAPILRRFRIHMELNGEPAELRDLIQHRDP